MWMILFTINSDTFLFCGDDRAALLNAAARVLRTDGGLPVVAACDFARRHLKCLPQRREW